MWDNGRTGQDWVFARIGIPSGAKARSNTGDGTRPSKGRSSMVGLRRRLMNSGDLFRRTQVALESCVGQKSSNSG
jgi:hypothetical protein